MISINYPDFANPSPHSSYLSTDILAVVLPDNTSSLLSQCMAGTLGGFTGAFIMNPVDIIRSRIQVFSYNAVNALVPHLTDNFDL